MYENAIKDNEFKYIEKKNERYQFEYFKIKKSKMRVVFLILPSFCT